MLSKAQIEEFHERGVLVIDDVLSDADINEARKGLAEALLVRGVDIANPDTEAIRFISELSSTHGAGGVLDIFYDKWKMKLLEHELIVRYICALLEATFATCSGIYEHPFGNFDAYQPYAYIDRICCRLPDDISIKYGSKRHPLQRGLAPHLDCCPTTLYDNLDTKSKWKPIQAFIALTDTVESDMGGFECCPGLHKDFTAWTTVRPSSTNNSSLCFGEFTPMRPVEDADILARFEAIPCRRGSLVLWDNRIPHANARRNLSSATRQVVYIGMLPAVAINKKYAERQLQRMREGLLPNDQWHSSKQAATCDYEFSALGRRLLAIDPWT